MMPAAPVSRTTYLDKHPGPPVAGWAKTGRRLPRAYRSMRCLLFRMPPSTSCLRICYFIVFSMFVHDQPRRLAIYNSNQLALSCLLQLRTLEQAPRGRFRSLHQSPRAHPQRRRLHPLLFAEQLALPLEARARRAVD